MSEYYFDIETSDSDTQKDQVIAVTFQRITFNGPSGDLTILKAWDRGGERTLLGRVRDLGVFDTVGAGAFNFVPVGFNLAYDFNFLITRMQALGVKRWTKEEVMHFFHNKPTKDIKTGVVMMNYGRFMGSGLDQFTRKKKTSGEVIPSLWAARNYNAIEDYIRDEVEGFFELYGHMAEVLLALGIKRRVKEVPDGND